MMSAKTVKLLIIEDHPDYFQILRNVISREQDPAFEILHAATLRNGLEHLSNGSVDLILADLQLPDSKGLETFRQVHRASPNTPIVILTALDDQKVAVEAVRNGAQDYLVKGRADAKSVIPVMRYAMERKHVERELRRAHDEKEQLLSSITSILIGINDKGAITHWNHVAEKTFGVKASEVLGRAITDCGVDWSTDAILNALEECRRQSKPLRLDDLRFRRSDGQMRILGFTLIPLKGEDAEAADVLLFGADVTARRQAEEMKSEFVSTVSHEFRTPLTIIKEGVLQVLEGLCGETTPAQRETLSLCLEGIERLARIVDDLLDISKIESGKIALRRELVDLAEVAREIISIFESQTRSRDLVLKFQCSKEPLEIYVDRDRMARIFTNLIGNSLKFTERGSIEITLAEKGAHVECSVADTGKGIPKEDLPRVFSKFEQFTREMGAGTQGTGLGLAICKGLIEAHRGQIWIESKLGEGTKVSFSLPKYSPRDLLKEYVHFHLKDDIAKDVPLSLVVMRVEAAAEPHVSGGEGRVGLLLGSLERVARSSLRRKADMSVRDGHRVAIVLPETAKQDALGIVSRIQRAFEKALIENREDQRGAKVAYQIASFPEDGSTDQALLNKVLY